jgi:hypothetical protein
LTFAEIDLAHGKMLNMARTQTRINLPPLATLDDPELKEGKLQYRWTFSRVGKFKEVVPIYDHHTMTLINQDPSPESCLTLWKRWRYRS